MYAVFIRIQAVCIRCVSALCERNEWDVMNAEPGEEMRGLGQVIRVVNNPLYSGDGQSAGSKAAVSLSIDMHSLYLFLCYSIN